MTVIGFDLDMTLVDSADAIVDSIAHTCRVYGVEMVPAAQFGFRMPTQKDSAP